jgi:hypothetical protein
LIGVIAKKAEEEIVKEFFELFKTPWEFYRKGCSYDVILTTEDDIGELNVKLVIVYGSNEKGFDREHNFKTINRKKSPVLEHKEHYFPIYGNVLIFDGAVSSVLRVKETTDAAGIEISINDKKILRVGFDLFQEINFLLSSGQPAEYAHVPTLEIHISLLRDWILDSGMSLVEIPPIPAGYTFIACLTHDVDFVGISRHKFDHTLFGFLYRALIGSFMGLLRGRISWRKLWRNWKSVILLPLVYLGIAKDFMLQFDRYIDIERGMGSTFFIIPYKNRPGQNNGQQSSKRRATKYDISNIVSEINKLITHGFEVGLHGIDAWHDSAKGHEELKRITDVAGESNIGVRMHWLYYGSDSPKILDDAGFLYDSSFGYNDTIGYKAGTGQAFRPPGIRRLLELPLIIMDTALFYPAHMDLTEAEARKCIREMIKGALRYGGVITINWHHRSIGPERLWDDFYIELLENFRKSNAWIATAQQAVKWYRKRRSFSFSNSMCSDEQFHLKLKDNDDSDVPDLLLRVHTPESTDYEDIVISQENMVVDMPLSLHRQKVET